MKKAAICIALVGLMALGGQAIAEIGTIDDVPAATLLLPNFAVDLNNPDQLTTLFSINNASAAPAIAHVTLWTDWSVPTLDFNVYLTGYDVVTVNLRDVFVNGIVPVTSTLAPVGLFSLPSLVPPASTALCDQNLPSGPLPPVLLTLIQEAHTGNPSSFPGPSNGLCYGEPFGDNIARGYITVDNANFCSLEFPNSPGYFVDDGQGTASNVNQLWGDYFYVDVVNDFAQGETLVHIEADNALSNVADVYTFYRRYSLTGQDDREGLASTFAVRFAEGGAFDGGTSLLVWRDSKQDVGPTVCAPFAPNWAPLAQTQIVIFDEDENPVVPQSVPFSPPIPGESLIPFPLETNRTQVGGNAFPVPFSFGWLYLNLNSVVDGQVVNVDPPATLQNWVTAVIDATGRFSVGFDAIQLDNVTDPATRSDISLPICDGAPDPAGC